MQSEEVGLTNGNEYCTFDLDGVTCGILICYDNNVIENVRITALMGTEVIFMPHVTCCLPSEMLTDIEIAFLETSSLHITLKNGTEITPGNQNIGLYRLMNH